eukprot:TRINITY_DN91132_c0_g1_i1.p1 TRINITY_DN91132_c0_g1~~TRINITY_DN91132_c0_g1_i1.p1  ORF type:complete len:215 (+),score=48.63 TRINITY_DN91132_c0_g1_i1:73-645(+)
MAARALPLCLLGLAMMLLSSLMPCFFQMPWQKGRSQNNLRRRSEPVPAFPGDKPQHDVLDVGTTPLMEAAFTGDAAKIKKLAAAGADLDAQDLYGWTAIRYAVRNAKFDAAKELLSLGANTNVASKSGRTPLMSAAANGLAEMCELLVEQGDADVMAHDDRGMTAFDMAMRSGPMGSAKVRDIVSCGQRG